MIPDPEPASPSDALRECTFDARSSAGRCSGMPSATDARPLFFGLERMPVGFHLLGGVRIGVSEDVRVAPDQLLDDATSDIVYVPALIPSLLGDAGMEDNLQ